VKCWEGGGIEEVCGARECIWMLKLFHRSFCLRIFLLSSSFEVKRDTSVWTRRDVQIREETDIMHNRDSIEYDT
jgi:hypothetical protein